MFQVNNRVIIIIAEVIINIYFLHAIRDYKEHGARRGDDVVAGSTPSLNRDQLDKTVRSWTSTSNLATAQDVIEVTAPLRLRQRPSSWSSTPDLDESHKGSQKYKENDEIVVSVQIPARRRNVANLDSVEESFTLKRPTSQTQATSPPVIQSRASLQPLVQQRSVETDETITINKTDSLAERVRKMQMMKRQGSLERELGPNSREGSVPRK